MNIPLEATQSREDYLDWLSLASHEYFPRLERQAAAARRTGAVRLRERDLHQSALVRRRAYRLLRRSVPGPRRASRRATSTSARSRRRSARCTRPRGGWSNRSRWRPTMRGSSSTAPDENTPNTAISYYVKGAVIGFLLDAHIRRLTSGAKSLDDVMRLMCGGFPERKDSRARTCAPRWPRSSGPAHAREMRAWMARALETTAELDYADAMAWFGLHMTPPPAAPRAYLGVTTRAKKMGKRS